MSSFSFLLICIQACLVKSVFGQLYNAGGYGYNGLSVEVDAISSATAGLSGYGNAGLIGNGLGNLGLGGYGLGLGSAGLAVGGLGLGNAGLAVGGLGYGNAGLGLGYGNAGLGLGLGSAGLAVGNAGLVGSGLTGYGGVSNVAASAALPVAGPFIANGVGELAVGGNLNAAGTAVVTGQVPVLGAVSFNGGIPASGAVSIAGNCACAGVPL